MFFYLSKTISYLTMPYVLVCILFAVSYFLSNKNWKKFTFKAGLVMLFFFSNDFIANEVMSAWEVPTKPYKDMRPHEIGIVLTGLVIPELSPADRVYFSRGADRVVHAVQLYKLGLVKKLLISGGSGRILDIGEREAEKVKDAMVLMGIPPGDIWVESKTRNTYESAVEVKKILDSLKYDPAQCLLVTSAFHMRRSLACYRKAGMELEAFSTDFYSHPRKFHVDILFVPKVDAMLNWHKIIKEWVGLMAYKLAGYV